jgi:hypothetical protein
VPTGLRAIPFTLAVPPDGWRREWEAEWVDEHAGGA